MKRLISMVLATAALSACSTMRAPVMATAPQLTPTRAQSDSGVRSAIKTIFELGFRSADKNHDSFITPDELNMAPADWAKADTDKDNKLSLKEYLYVSNKLGQMAFQGIKQQTYLSFTALDRDRDSFVTLDELKASLKDKPPEGIVSAMQLFFSADRSRDGKLTLSEYEDVAVWALVVGYAGLPPGYTPPATPLPTPPPYVPPMPTQGSSPNGNPAPQPPGGTTPPPSAYH